MALSNYQVDPEPCCLAGFIYTTCTHCGGGRTRDTCKKCGGSGSTGSPCPVHATPNSTKSYVGTNNPPAYGSTGYGGNPGYGQQQGYGSTSGR